VARYRGKHLIAKNGCSPPHREGLLPTGGEEREKGRDLTNEYEVKQKKKDNDDKVKPEALHNG